VNDTGADITCLGRSLHERRSALVSGDAIGDDDIQLAERIIARAEDMGGAPLTAVGHRVVHGGRKFPAPVRISHETFDAIADLVPLAPLHQPHNLTGIRAVQKLRPGVVQIACFDTSFHRSQPEIQRRYALPEECYEAGVERYGFHGISYDWAVRKIAYLRGALPPRVLIFHLGSGSSACAIHNGRSQATSMGFSALDGLMMGTRPGNLDAGVILHWLAQGKSHSEISNMLYTKSGLLGVSGRSNDMRTLLASNDPSAVRAVDMFCRQAAAVGASLVPAIGGLDAIVFTGGIGENAAQIRAGIVARLEYLGVLLSPHKNAANAGLISALDSSVEVWVIRADEERLIAQETLRLLEAS
jgi:acetate kinase